MYIHIRPPSPLPLSVAMYKPSNLLCLLTFPRPLSPLWCDVVGVCGYGGAIDDALGGECRRHDPTRAKDGRAGKAIMPYVCMFVCIYMCVYVYIY
jgi:hypothetical protein